MTIGILGGGIASLSLAANLDEKTIIFERENELGGLCRSFDLNGLVYDIGPHIIFSKNQEVLELHNSLVEVESHKRLNRILLNGHYTQYPFENFLGSLAEGDRDRALVDFLNNPYSDLPVTSMQQFFLSKFGEGMTDLYFRPYNAKIWKFDPAALDLQMVERIPNPPRQDVVDGANGTPKEGYVHQAVFTYPKEGGFASLISAYEEMTRSKGHLINTDADVKSLHRNDDGTWNITTSSGTTTVDKVISTVPLPNLPKLLTGIEVPEAIFQAADEMKFNSIHIVMMQFRGDRLTDQFALYVPDTDVIFHRLSRLNFLGKAYGSPEVFNLMAEVTFRPDSHLSRLTKDEVLDECLRGLDELGIANKSELIDFEVRSFQHAYVIYDMNHRKRTDMVLDWLAKAGITCHGRFGKFEYQNSDAVVEDSLALAAKLNA